MKWIDFIREKELNFDEITKIPMKYSLSLFFTVLFSFIGAGQFYPEQNAHINFTSICFKFPFKKDADNYKIQLYNSKSELFKTVSSKANKIVINGFDFSKEYFWKVQGFNGSKSVYESPILHFEIDSVINKADLRFKCVTNLKRESSKELLVYDYAGMVLNRTTEPLWFIPNNPEGVPISKGMRDLKLTRDGTFLALIDSMAYEFDLEGNIIWKAPNTGKIAKRNTEDYHHDFQKLPNGDYVVLGNEKVKAKFKGERDSLNYESGFIVQYNRLGDVVWEWHAKSFFTPELLAIHKKEDGRINPATHMNSFHWDENYVYVGFRDASWILKIDKTSKKVVEIYGGTDSGLPNHYAIGLFRFQHDTELLSDGKSMAIINNDSISDPKIVSSMIVFSLGDEFHQKGELLYRFAFNFDNKTNGKSLKMGNVTQLDNGNFLINMGSLNRVIEITPQSKVVWDCFTEKLDSTKTYWHPFSHYRVSTCSSLYPNVLSVLPKLLDKTNSSIKLQLTLFNVGSEDQNYEFLLLNKRKEVIDNFNGNEKFLKCHQSDEIEFTVENKDAEYLLIRAKGTGVSEFIDLDAF